MPPMIGLTNPPAEALVVRGTLPAGLSGHFVGVGPDVAGRDAVVHSISLHDGGLPSLRSRVIGRDATTERIGTDPELGSRGTAPDLVGTNNLITFGGSILAIGIGTLAYELTADLASLRRVDLAGRSRRLAGFPKHDPLTGELHLLAVAPDGSRAHVVVSAGALTRRSRPLSDAPSAVTDLAVTGDRVVLAADGYVGVTARGSEMATHWIATGAPAPLLVHAHDAGESVVALAVTPSLERWTLHPESGAIRRDVLERTPRRSARLAGHLAGPPRFVWTMGDHSVDKHDLMTSKSTHLSLDPDRTGSDFAFVADQARGDDPDGGWLVGFVRGPARDETDLVIVDAADMDRRTIASIGILRHGPGGLSSAWIPRPDR